MNKRLVFVLLAVLVLMLCTAAVAKVGITFERAIRMFEHIVLYDRSNGCYVNFQFDSRYVGWVVIDQWGVTELKTRHASEAIEFLSYGHCQP